MRKFIGPFLLVFLILVIFHPWLTPGLLSAYDFPFYSQLMMKEASLRLYAWNWHVGFDGFAGFFSPYSWVFPFIYMPQVIFGKYLGMDWAFIERVVYLYPLLILLILSPIYLFRALFPNNKFYLISVIIYSFNTYSLLLAGSEVFVALAYALIPIILALFMRIANCELRINHSVLLGLVLAIQIMFDPRVTYVTMSIIILYLLFNYGLRITNYGLQVNKSVIRNPQVINYKIIFYLLIPFIIAGLLNAFWIIPTVLYGKNPVAELGSSYSTTGAVKYLSFAKLEQTISLLQQNWPENIFGKTYFMRWEFLFLPILAFSSLLFINLPITDYGLRIKKNNNPQSARRFEEASPLGGIRNPQLNIIFFALLGLVGAFLSKGANEPLGGIYLWMFDNIPGFIMFRDPAKWYPLVAISYSILIPFSVYNIYLLLKKKFNDQKFTNYELRITNSIRHAQSAIKQLNNYIPTIFLFFIICYLLFLIRPALSGQLGGFYKKTSVPKDYVVLEKFLYNQPNFFRTLWFPSKQHFGFYSNTHPEISARALFNNYDDNELFKKLSDREAQKVLEEASIKYIIIPFDSEKEIFLTDRKYDDSKYKLAINNLQKISWLKQISIPENCELRITNCKFGRIAVFEVANPKDHFYLTNPQSARRFEEASPLGGIRNQSINYKYITPVKYIVNIENANRGDRLLFSEKYDKYWKAKQITDTELRINKNNPQSARRFEEASPLGGIRNTPFVTSNPQSLNSFILPEEGSYSLEVYYEPQKWVDIGTGISLISLITIIVLFLINWHIANYALRIERNNS